MGRYCSPRFSFHVRNVSSNNFVTVLLRVQNISDKTTYTSRPHGKMAGHVMSFQRVIRVFLNP